MSQLGRYAHIWSCTFGYKAVLSNLIYGHKWGMPSPNMGILYSYDISNLHIWAQGYGHKWGMPKYGSYMATNEACPNMGILYSYDISNLHIWAQKGQWDMPKYGVCCLTSMCHPPHMGTNGACQNMGILYTDDISNLHIWSQKGQGLTDSEIQLSRATDPAAMPIYGLSKPQIHRLRGLLQS